MGKRGPTPVDIGLLNAWEFEWYKAFHLLRDGLELPYSRAEKLRWVDRSINRSRLERLQKMSVRDYYIDLLRAEFHTREEVSLLVRNRSNLEWAEREQRRELAWLKGSIQPRQIEKAAERRKIWIDLISARTLSALRITCDSWVQLRKERSGRFAYFPADSHILANSERFLTMKRNVRFPRSGSADDSRLAYLARGMAGVMAGLSPMTAIERLRNMDHTSRGAMWKAKEQHCSCWRCELDRSDKLHDTLNDIYKKELKR